VSYNFTQSETGIFVGNFLTIEDCEGGWGSSYIYILVDVAYQTVCLYLAGSTESASLGL